MTVSSEVAAFKKQLIDLETKFQQIDRKAKQPWWNKTITVKEKTATAPQEHTTVAIKKTAHADTAENTTSKHALIYGWRATHNENPEHLFFMQR